MSSRQRKASAPSRTAAVTANPVLRIIPKEASRKFTRKFTGRERCDRAGRIAVTQKLQRAAAAASERGFVIVAVLWILAALAASGDDLFSLSVQFGAGVGHQ